MGETTQAGADEEQQLTIAEVVLLRPGMGGAFLSKRAGSPVSGRFVSGAH
jgi:hypothetical protein